MTQEFGRKEGEIPEQVAIPFAKKPILLVVDPVNGEQPLADWIQQVMYPEKDSYDLYSVCHGKAEDQLGPREFNPNDPKRRGFDLRFLRMLQPDIVLISTEAELPWWVGLKPEVKRLVGIPVAPVWESETPRIIRFHQKVERI